MSFSNIKLGYYKNYYNKSLYLKQYPLKMNDFREIYNKIRYNSFLLVYPIFYKKILFFEVCTQIRKRRNMKNKYNLNQSLILEGSISGKRCTISLPYLSLSLIIH